MNVVFVREECIPFSASVSLWNSCMSRTKDPQENTVRDAFRTVSSRFFGEVWSWVKLVVFMWGIQMILLYEFVDGKWKGELQGSDGI